MRIFLHKIHEILITENEQVYINHQKKKKLLDNIRILDHTFITLIIFTQSILHVQFLIFKILRESTGS